jgi:hypothetical protein
MGEDFVDGQIGNLAYGAWAKMELCSSSKFRSLENPVGQIANLPE